MCGGHGAVEAASRAGSAGSKIGGKRVYGMNDRLEKAIDRLKSESAETQAPAGIERAVLAEFDRVTSKERRRRRSMAWVAAAGAVAASIAVVLSIVSTREHGPPTPSSNVAGAVSEDVRESEQPFVPIPYVTPLGTYERAEIVRMEVPVAALIAAGLPMRTTDPGARAQADVIVGQDGRARAVRLISVSREGE